MDLWDILLVIAVTGQATLLAYTYSSKWKAVIYSFPIPFTFATLALGQSVNSTNVLGLVLLLGYTYAVYVLHHRLKVPIVITILLSAAGYCFGAMQAASILPKTESGFWISIGVTYALALILYFAMPFRQEPGHRSTLALWMKIPIIALVIIILVVLKNRMQGFMTVFPMVGVIASYESRYCLWTICRAIPVFMLAAVPMMGGIHVLTPRIGLIPALAIGWAVFLVIIFPATYLRWKTDLRNKGKQ